MVTRFIESLKMPCPPTGRQIKINLSNLNIGRGRTQQTKGGELCGSSGYHLRLIGVRPKRRHWPGA